MQKNKRINQFIRYINQILENREIDCDEEWWTQDSAQKELGLLSCANQDFLTDSEKMNMSGRELLIFAVFQNSSDTLYQMISNRLAALSPSGDFCSIHLIFFVRDMRSRVRLEKSFDSKILKSLRSTVRKALNRPKLPLSCTYILDQEYVRQDVKLKKLRRHEILQMPPISGKINLETPQPQRSDALNALVFTIDLLQLVELYNLVGDQLFQYNVRFGIRETLGVDQSIRETLEREPELFWFKNNGVTLLVENPDFKPRNVEELFLDRIIPGEKPRFSVVNGAQTITTSARYFFEKEYEVQNSTNETEALNRALTRSKTAQVLLRVIHIPSSPAENTTEMPSDTAKKISVALNRQKPIKVEDIAFTTPFVEKMTDYLSRKPFSQKNIFLLARRGEGDAAAKRLDLADFSRARAACAGNPGTARSAGSNELLKLRQAEDETFSFYHTDIFVDPWMQAESEQEEQIFRRDYGAVWFAHQTAMAYDACRRRITDGAPDFLTVIANGKWHFTAVLVQLLNGFSTYQLSRTRSLPDFSQFTCSFSDISATIPAAMTCFAEMVLLYAKTEHKYAEPDSNLFKKNDLYHGLVNALSCRNQPLRTETAEQTAFRKKMQEFAGLFPFLPPAPPAAYAQSAPSIQPAAYARASASQNLIILGEKQLPLESIAQAMLDTVSYILENYSPDMEALNARCSKWLRSGDAELYSETGYFRGTPKIITAGGKTYQVGTYSNTAEKCRQIRLLCELANVPANEIAWYQNALDTPVFSW